MKIVFLLSGEAGSGKGTVAQMIREHFIPNYVPNTFGCEYPFAKGSQDTCFVATLPLAFPLKKVVQSIWGVDPNTLQEERNTPVENLGDWTPRKLWQFIGTEVGRNVNENTWINLWYKEFKRVSSAYFFIPNQIFICDDVRFPNEQDGLNALCYSEGFNVVKVFIKYTGNKVVVPNHESEQHFEYLWRQADYYIKTSNLESLREAVNSMLAKVEE